MFYVSIGKEIKISRASKKRTIERVLDIMEDKLFGLKPFSMRKMSNKILKQENLCSKVSSLGEKRHLQKHHLPVNFPPETPHCDSNPGIQSLELISRRQEKNACVICILAYKSRHTSFTISWPTSKGKVSSDAQPLFSAFGIKKVFCMT